MLAVLQVPVSAIGINERGCSLRWLSPKGPKKRRFSPVRRPSSFGPGEPTCNPLTTLILARRTSFISPKARGKLLKERQDVAALQLTTDEQFAFRVDAVHLKHRLRYVGTDGLA